MVIFLSQIGLYSTLRQAIAPLSRKFSLATIRGSMSTLGSLDFVDLEVPRAQLHPELTLIMGQCFAWQRLTKDKDLPMWVAVLEGCPVVIKQDKARDTTLFANLLSDSVKQKDEMQDYFQLQYDLEGLYTTWSAGCPRMSTVCNALHGVRVLRQEPWECLISFICSSNNNIKRITLMLDRLRRTYGNYICSVKQVVRASGDKGESVVDYEIVKEECPPVISFDADGNMLDPLESVAATPGDTSTNTDVVHLFSFPTVTSLAQTEEAQLRALGMGYRAKFIKGTAAKVIELGDSPWLYSLRTDTRPIKANGGDSSTAANIVTMKQEPQDMEGTYLEEQKDVTVMKEKGEHAAVKTINKYQHASPFQDDIQGIKQEPLAERKKRSPSKKVKAEAPLLSHRLYVNDQLQLLPGVGRKVADCVALFSLDQSGSIPVDVHVWEIAVRDYQASLMTTASLTPTIYEEVGDLFRNRFGTHAGWAHSVLFAAELPEFKKMLPIEMQKEMDSFTQEMRQRSAQKKEEAKKRKEVKEGQNTKERMTSPESVAMKEESGEAADSEKKQKLS